MSLPFYFFIYLFVYGLFNDVDLGSDYTECLGTSPTKF